MKKTVLSWLLFVSLLAVGCDDNVLPDIVENKVEGRQVDVIEKVNPNDNYRAEVESFCDAERDYYIFTMGTIDNVPIEIPVFFYYGGKGEIEQTFSRTNTTVSSVSTTVQNVVQKKMAWENYAEINASVSAKFLKIFEAAVSAKLYGKETSEHTTTETRIYSTFEQKTESLSNSISVKFDERYQAGYYSYVVSATIKVRFVLVRDRTTGAVYTITYNELLSCGYSFVYNELSSLLPVDKNQKFEFEVPDIESLPAPTEFIGVINITTPKEFAKINENLTGEYVLLTDLDFEGAPIKPIGGSNGRFTGTILGNGHTIKNFFISADYPCVGIVARNAGRIENLHVRNAYVSAQCTDADAVAGVIAGENTGTISDCSVSDSSIKIRAVDKNNTENKSRYAIAGGIAGKVSGGEIENCSVKDVSLYGYAKKHDTAWSEGWNEAVFLYIGGIAGEQIDGMVLNNTAQSLELEGYAEYRGNAFVQITTRSRICLGGIIGRQTTNAWQHKNTITALSFKKTFNSYNELIGLVNPIEEYYQGEKVGRAD